MINTKKTYTAYGHIDEKGVLSIYNRLLLDSTLKTYFKKTSIEIVFSEKTSAFSDNMRSYYFGVVVKEVQKAYLSTGVVKSLKDIDYELRGLFLYKEFYNENKGVWETEPHTLKKGDTEVTRQMMRGFIDMVIAWSIQNLDWAIPYPSEDMGKEDYTNHQKNSKLKGNGYKNTF